MAPSTSSDQEKDVDDLFAQAADQPAPSRPAGKKKVLLVEDSKMARHKLGAILKQLNVDMVEAANGEQGIALAQKTNPDLIILDVQMPVKDGIETLRELRAMERFKEVPIVMLTVQADTSTVSQALNEKISEYILKDSDPLDIKKRLEKHIKN